MTILNYYYSFILSEDLILKDNNIHNLFHIPSLNFLSINFSSIEAKTEILSAFPLICGQKFQKTKAKKAISQFKIRQNQIIGCHTTLRHHSLFAFLDKCLFFLFPNTFVFFNHTILKSHYHLSLLHLSMPEIENFYDWIQMVNGIHLNISMSTKSKKACRLILTGLRLFVNRFPI